MKSRIAMMTAAVGMVGLVATGWGVDNIFRWDQSGSSIAAQDASQAFSVFIPGVIGSGSTARERLDVRGNVASTGNLILATLDANGYQRGYRFGQSGYQLSFISQSDRSYGNVTDYEMVRLSNSVPGSPGIVHLAPLANGSSGKVRIGVDPADQSVLPGMLYVRGDIAASTTISAPTLSATTNITTPTITASTSIISSKSLLVGTGTPSTSTGVLQVGTSNTVSAGYAMASGSGNSVSTSYSAALGINNTVNTSTYGFAIGATNTASGNAAIAAGQNCVVSASRSVALGSQDTVRGSFGNAAIGFGNLVKTGTGSGQVVVGMYGVAGPGVSGVADDTMFAVGIGANAQTRKNAVTVRGDGKVLIGQKWHKVSGVVTNHLLHVNGDAVAYNFIADGVAANWPDYVFKKDYNLKDLSQVESFIKKNGHLEGVPTAQQVKENGIDLGKTQVALLEKVEELTLYTINLSKQNEILQKEVAALKAAR